MLDGAECVCVCALRQQREKPRGKLNPEHGLEARTLCVCVFQLSVKPNSV